jgi:hypothetical protein
MDPDKRSAWWRSVPNGTYAFFIRAGFKPIEFDKGKTAIAVHSLNKLPTVIDTLITAVRNGELDDALAHTAKQATPKKPRKAAQSRVKPEWGAALGCSP